MSDTTATASSAPSSSSGQLGVMTPRDMGLYAMMILVWGTSWIAMASQVDIVPPIITGVYRFALAASAMFVWAVIGKYPLRYPLRTHLRFMLLGVFIFSSNFVLFYYAASHMASGLMAVIFSTASLINIILSSIVFGERPSRTGLIGAVMGLSGIALIFWPQITLDSGDGRMLIGLALGLAGTLCFCTGNMITIANKKLNVPLVSANAWGMAYGTLWLIFLSVVLDEPYLFDGSAKYWLAMTWLVIMASVVAFWGYMSLLNSIGAARAGYLTVLFPIVALGLSTIFEGYQWSLWGLIGLAAIIAGNILVMQGRRT